MSRELTVNELREKPDVLIEAIENGETVTIVRDGKTIGSVSPSQHPRGGVPYPFRDFDFGSRPKGLLTDPAELIIEERQRERSGKKYGL